MSIFISASMLEDFISCNRKVYYRINHPELAIKNKEMVIGDIVHKAIEKYSNDEEACYEYSEKELSTRLPKDYSSIKFSKDCLQSFFHVFREQLHDNDKIEVRFKLPHGKDVFIVGKMDRISNGNVFDWKTARRPLSNLSGNIQFILYNWAYKELYGKEPYGVYYAALTNGALVRYKHDEVAEKVLFSEVIPDALEVIRRGDYIHNGIFRKACYRCSYSETCLKELYDVLDNPALVEE